MKDNERAIQDFLAGESCRPITFDPGLTDIEKEILRLLSGGMEAKEIAEVRGVSHHTVANQVRVINRKLKAKNRSHAVAIALRAGIVVALCAVTVLSDPAFYQFRLRSSQSVRISRQVRQSARQSTRWQLA